jgi:signal transduction histidine kinase/ActR/RegA family two-component response regulator
MKRWFLVLPLHRKLIVMALVVSATALLAAVTGLIVVDLARFRSGAADDTRALAEVIAENSAAAIVFDDADAARDMLDSVRVRPTIALACAYRANGTLLAVYERTTVDVCPAAPGDRFTWRAVGSRVPVVRNQRTVGAVYVERRLSDLGGRVAVTSLTALLMLALASGLAFAVARRLQQTISAPIVLLARAARQISQGDLSEVPPIATVPDETGDLVRSFSDMVRKLVSTNASLKVEIDQRTRAQTEREALLIREREASRLKDEFLAAVSHELRTPLNAIYGWTQVLAGMKTADPTIRRAVDSLLRNTEAQRHVIEDLLDVSRIITGKVDLKLTHVELSGAVEAAMEVIEPTAKAKNIALTFEPAAGACVILADVDRLRQIIWNLLSNAVKFTAQHGAVVVRVSRGEACEVAVADTGVGIVPEFLPFVFDRFRQADGSTTRRYGGLGLGLAIVKELTELQGGRVDVRSPGVGLGATFAVTFPAAPVDLTRAASSRSTAQSDHRRLDGVRVLAIDDNVDALDILQSALGGAGATVELAIEGADAVERIHTRLPDVVLCDLAMPDMDGFEVLARIRASGVPGSTTVPVIAVSAHVSAAIRDRCRQAGFFDHIAKPVDVDALLDVIASAVA